MRVKVDEDLPKAALTFVANYGHGVMGVLIQGMGGWKDPALWQAIQAEGRFLITADKGFADIRTYPPGHMPGFCSCARIRVASDLWLSCFSGC